MELAFFWFDKEFGILEYLKDLINILFVFFEYIRENKDIVEVDDNEFIKLFS